MADIAGDLGTPAIGTQFGIFTFRDYDAFIACPLSVLA